MRTSCAGLASKLNPKGRLVLFLGEEDVQEVCEMRRWDWESPIRIPGFVATLHSVGNCRTVATRQALRSVPRGTVLETSRDSPMPPGDVPRETSCIPPQIIAKFPLPPGSIVGTSNLHCQSKRRCWQDNHRRKPRSVPRSFREAHAPHRLRSPGKHNQRPWISQGSGAPHIVSNADIWASQSSASPSTQRSRALI